MAPRYDYLANLERMLQWVETHHSHLLDADARAFCRDFRRLPRPAKHLYVRLTLRRGPWFRLDGLSYPEVDCTETAAVLLALAGMARFAAANERTQRLDLLRVPELRALLGAKGRMRRSQLLEACAGQGAVLAGRLPAAICLSRSDALAYLQLLYFGNPHQDLAEFILSDLGIQRFEQVSMRPSLPWRTATEARRDLHCHRWADRVGQWAFEGLPESELDLLPAAAEALVCPGVAETTEGRRNRALTRLARILDSRGARVRALALLAAASGPPAREAHCRALARAGRPYAAALRLEEITASARDAGEARFAARFDPLRGRCRPSPRAGGLPRRRLHLRRPEAGVRIESAVTAALQLGGCRVLHLENALVGLLVGLGFWDVIFAPLRGVFVQPFQRAPLDLFDPMFRRRRADAITARLDALASGDYGPDAMLGVWRRKYGLQNALISWTRFTEYDVTTIIEALTPAHRALLCDRALADPAMLRRGFPDLVVLGGRGLCDFVEVKGPGDALRPEQQQWLQALTAAGLQARLLEVRWA